MKIPGISLGRFACYSVLVFITTICFSCNSANHNKSNISFGKFNQSADKITTLSVPEDSYVAMKKDNQLNSMNVLVALIFIALLIGLGVVISRRNKQLKKLNKKIILQNSELQQTLDALEQSQHENTWMMKMVTHDLRDPIGAMMSVVALLLEEEHDPKSQKEFLTLMQSSGANLLEMISGMLSSNITMENMKKKDVDMKTLLTYGVDLLKFKADNKRQRIYLDAEEVVLKTDREKIWRVISNLISNAMKFSPEKAEIEVGMHKMQGIVRISVKDSGIGIPVEMQDKIFDIDADKRREGTQGERSFGLGLYISKRIVEVLEGKIWFESKEGSGTTFYVEFPV